MNTEQQKLDIFCSWATDVAEQIQALVVQASQPNLVFEPIKSQMW